MTHSASTLVHDDISEQTFVTMVAIGIVAVLVGIISLIPPHFATAADVPSLAQFFL